MYTDMPIVGEEELVDKLACDMYRKLSRQFPDKVAVDDFCKRLPKFLQGFAQCLLGERDDPRNKQIAMIVSHRKR